jgi:hypothetical protein
MVSNPVQPFPFDTFQNINESHQTARCYTYKAADKALLKQTKNHYTGISSTKNVHALYNIR